VPVNTIEYIINGGPPSCPLMNRRVPSRSILSIMKEDEDLEGGGGWSSGGPTSTRLD